jgi:hypothetical protein
LEVSVTPKGLLIAVVVPAFAACSQGSNPIAPSATFGAAVAGNASVHAVTGNAAAAAATTLSANAKFQAPFTAIAACSPDIGRIQFTGTIVGIDQTTVDGRGETHRIRQFRVKDLTGLNLDDGGTEYTVIGGAEILSWNSQTGQVPGMPARSTHAGTLVFAPDDGGANVIAHHSIHYLEDGTGDVVLQLNDWRCVTSDR